MLRTTISISVALSFTLLVVPGCKKKEGDGGGKAKTAEGAPAGGEAKPAAGKPIEMEAKALFADYNKPGQDGLALLEKWRPGVVVTGTVINTIAEENGFLHVWVDGGDNHRVTLDFTDEGKAAKDKGVKKDDKVTAQCEIGGSDGNMMMLTGCTLK